MIVHTRHCLWHQPGELQYCTCVSVLKKFRPVGAEPTKVFAWRDASHRGLRAVSLTWAQLRWNPLLWDVFRDPLKINHDWACPHETLSNSHWLLSAVQAVKWSLAMGSWTTLNNQSEGTTTSHYMLVLPLHYTQTIIQVDASGHLRIMARVCPVIYLERDTPDCRQKLKLWDLHKPSDWGPRRVLTARIWHGAFDLSLSPLSPATRDYHLFDFEKRTTFFPLLLSRSLLTAPRLWKRFVKLFLQCYISQISKYITARLKCPLWRVLCNLSD